MNDQTRRAAPGELTSGQVHALRALLESELRSALGAAREGGLARAAIDATIADRGRRLGGSVHDCQDPLDEGGTVAEQG
jgi:hypothetical protein